MDYGKTVVIAHYTDHESGWPRVNNDLPCSEKPTVQARNGFRVINFNGSHTYSLKMIIRGGARRRFQFFTVEKCDKPLGEVEYEAHFLRTGDGWSSEFSVNESGLHILYTLCLMCFIALVAAHSFSSYLLYKILNHLHPIMTLFSIALGFQFLSTIFYFVYFNQINSTGYAYKILDHIGYLFEVVARAVFLFQLILMARGWSISRRVLNQRLRIYIFLGVFVALSVLSWIVKIVTYQSRSVETPSVVIVVDWIVLIYYISLCGFYCFISWKTYREENNPVKQIIYRNIGLVYGSYLLACATISILSFAVDPWVREKTVEYVTVIATFMAMSYMVHLLWHNKAHTTFHLEKSLDIMSPFGAQPTELSDEPSYVPPAI